MQNISEQKFNNNWPHSLTRRSEYFQEQNKRPYFHISLGFKCSLGSLTIYGTNEIWKSCGDLVTHVPYWSCILTFCGNWVFVGLVYQFICQEKRVAVCGIIFCVVMFMSGRWENISNLEAFRCSRKFDI